MGSQGVGGLSVCLCGCVGGGKRGKRVLVLEMQTVAVGAVNICSSSFKINFCFS